MKLARITITGKWPMSIDGLDMGYTGFASRVFYLTPEGIERKGKLYKTFDTGLLAEKFGVINPKITTSLYKN